MSIFENSNQLNPSFLTSVWLFFSLIAVGTAMIGFDAGGGWQIVMDYLLGSIVIACLIKII